LSDCQSDRRPISAPSPSRSIIACMSRRRWAQQTGLAFGPIHSSRRSGR
jgi:hypothetical protein